MTWLVDTGWFLASTKEVLGPTNRVGRWQRWKLCIGPMTGIPLSKADLLLLLNAHRRGWILTMVSFLEETTPALGKLTASDFFSLLELKAFLNMDLSSML